MRDGLIEVVYTYMGAWFPTVDADYMTLDSSGKGWFNRGRGSVRLHGRLVSY